MTDRDSQRRFEAEAVPAAINDLHDELDRFWSDLEDVPFEDQMAFTTAVIEAALSRGYGTSRPTDEQEDIA